MRAMDGGDPWEEVFAGQRSTADWPGGYFYSELMDYYPDAKVLLSVRDGESWERSFRQTIVEMCHGESLMPRISKARAAVDVRWERYLELVDRMFWGPQGTFADGWAEPEQLIEQMHAHNEQVKQAVPAERLLVWDVKRGLGAAVRVPRAGRAGDAAAARQRARHVRRTRHQRRARLAAGLARAERRGRGALSPGRRARPD